MVDALKNRISKEYDDLKKQEQENQIIVDMVDNDIRHWKGKIKGPVSLFINYFSLILYIKMGNSLLILLFLMTILSNLLR